MTCSGPPSNLTSKKLVATKRHLPVLLACTVIVKEAGLGTKGSGIVGLTPLVVVGHELVNVAGSILDFHQIKGLRQEKMTLLATTKPELLAVTHLVDVAAKRVIRSDPSAGFLVHICFRDFFGPSVHPLDLDVILVRHRLHLDNAAKKSLAVVILIGFEVQALGDQTSKIKIGNLHSFKGFKREERAKLRGSAKLKLCDQTYAL